MNDVILSEKLRKLPILKNGNDISLGLVRYKNSKFSIFSTCPVDSIFQILLASATDNEKILEYVKRTKNDNGIYAMVAHVAENKIDQKTYKRRLQIYIDYQNLQKLDSEKYSESFSKEAPLRNSIQAINGACNIVSMANYLFKNSASFEEKAICQLGCPEKIKYLPSLTITESEICKLLGEVIKEHLTLPSKVNIFSFTYV